MTNLSPQHFTADKSKRTQCGQSSNSASINTFRAKTVVRGGRETGTPGSRVECRFQRQTAEPRLSAVENGITSQLDGFLLEHAGKPATSLHQFLPLEFSIDEYLGWNGQLAEIPVQGKARPAKQ